MTGAAAADTDTSMAPSSSQTSASSGEPAQVSGIYKGINTNKPFTEQSRKRAQPARSDDAESAAGQAAAAQTQEAPTKRQRTAQGAVATARPAAAAAAASGALRTPPRSTAPAQRRAIASPSHFWAHTDSSLQTPNPKQRQATISVRKKPVQVFVQQPCLTIPALGPPHQSPISAALEASRWVVINLQPLSPHPSPRLLAYFAVRVPKWALCTPAHYHRAPADADAAG